ncbi:hypothetical protein [Nostoc commune]|uniref:hypothetical protein n=1 Tax=Nostoc commune TaxID=1178 RepID=UPI0018C5EABE|nr:hypothetical protein [Nostoc commune]
MAKRIRSPLQFQRLRVKPVHQSDFVTGNLGYLLLGKIKPVNTDTYNLHNLH